MRLGLVVLGIFVMAGGILVVVLPKTSLAARNLNLLEIDHGVPDGAVRNGIDKWAVTGILVVAGGLALIVVSPVVGLARTSTTLVSSSNPSSYAHAVTFTATVHVPGRGGAFTGDGTVWFRADGRTISDCVGQPLSFSGQSGYRVTCTTSSLPVGSHSIAAIYSGYGNFTGSSAELRAQVVR